MEFFASFTSIKLRSHLCKYLLANDDRQTVRQTTKASAEGAIWSVEFVEGKIGAIRLQSCHGRYLSATDLNFLLGATGKKVTLQTKYENLGAPWSVEWEPVRDGDRVKLMSWCGTFLRGNGVTPPWRNSVTHDEPRFSSTKGWILWDVEAVDETPKYCLLMSRRTWSMSNSSDEFSASGKSSPATPKSVRRSSTFQLKSCSANNLRSAMDFFRNAKTVRLRSHHDKYLVADNDEESVNQDRSGSSKTARWSVEFASGASSDSIIRLKSCYGKYLTASNQPFLLGMTGRKVLQTLPRRLDSSVEWEPVREGSQVKLKTRYGNFLRANGGLPPWRNSVTHDIPSRTATQDWILWDIDVVEIQVQSANHKAATIEHMDSLDFNPGSPPSASGKSSNYPRLESTDSTVSLPPKSEGRTIYYHVADESGDVDEDTVEGSSFMFKGNGVEELTHKMEEETGIKGIIVCTRNPLNGNLYPLRLQLPPNNATMHVVAVPESSKLGKDFEKQRLL
ncbi:uncharacterized protein LOC111493441 [Cucurbita maxima]|uniref:Uncharacterized protein LOC111493441 n=1 Tax=Cucurbita maxima TaxID=3661 RepID=A0A6J1KDX7_CUCMA|nr:uncharacterized protein LOC111493441 [Cucurbita maxima]